MQLRHVFSELGQGLRRNVSMHIAVVLTLFVSLILVGMGWLLNQQANKAENYFGNQLQITVWLCNDNDPSANCTSGITEDQRATLVQTITDNPEVDSQRPESQEEAYEAAKERYPEAFNSGEDSLGPEDLRESIWITLKDPRQSEGIISAVSGLDGVQEVTDLRDSVKEIFSTIDKLKLASWAMAGFLVLAALLLVANTIRLAAFARRKEIGIMRLVGASTLYIALPFLLEAVATAVIGIALASVAVWALLRFGVQDWLAETFNLMPWVGMDELPSTILVMAALGLVLTVVPTLVLTRKYLKV